MRRKYSDLSMDELLNIIEDLEKELKNLELEIEANDQYKETPEDYERAYDREEEEQSPYY